MDNEAPNYASWVPEAGGYVANGKVVSKSPVYDSQGKLRLDIDTSILNGALQPQTQAQPNMSHSQTAIEGHNQLAQKQAGIFTANQEGSGEDVNSLMTGAGSLGSLNNNTENSVFGVTNTPATKSPVVEEPILSPVDQAMKELQEAIARGNDYQAQINAYTKLERLTGQDYSAEIQDLTTKRQQKIENIDNDYASQISTALMRGDTAEVDRLRAEQSNWRQTVGYQDAMTQKYQTAREELDVDYQRTYWDGINDITQSLMQALPGILNFQYDPYQDTALQIAQGYATSRVKEQMNATGMYYSSMTQNAITKAVAELVPVYEKMAKEEAIQNFQLLQQTASFLVDLEQAQFNLWKGQLDVKFQANADKRAEIAAAWDKVNQLGYVDNETSAILGIPAGTESYATRKAYVDKLNEIDKENRNLTQEKALMDYEYDLQAQKMERQQQLDIEEYNEKARIDFYYDTLLEEQKALNDRRLQAMKGTSNGNDGDKKNAKYDVNGLIKYYNSLSGMLASGALTQEEVDSLLYDAAATDADYIQAITRINNGDLLTDTDKEASQKLTNLSDAAKTISNMELKTSLNDLLGKDWDDSKVVRTINSWLSNSAYSQADVEKAIEELALNQVYDTLDNEKKGFGKNFKSTDQALSSSLKAVEDFALMLNDTEWADKNAGIYTVYKGLVDRINGADNFDNSRWALMFDNDDMQKQGVKKVLDSLGKNSKLGGKSGVPYALLSSYISTGTATTTPVNRDNLKVNTPKTNTDLTGATANAKQKAFEKLKQNNNL